MSVALDDGTGIHVTSIKIKKIEDDINQNTTSNGNAANTMSGTSTAPATSVSGTSIASVNSSSKTRNESIDSHESAVDKSPTPVQHCSPVDPNRARSSIDEPVPADRIWTTQSDGAVKLKIKNSGPGSETPITVPTLIKSVAKQIPNNVAIAVKRDGVWVKWTYAEYLADIHRVAKSFIKLGLEPYKGVGIIGFNSPEWFLADLGAIFAGGLVAGIYTTNSPEACQFVAESCQANIVVVENNQQLQKILQVKDNLPHLKAIVQYTGEVAERQDNIYSWSEFMEKGKDVTDAELEERMKYLAPNKCCLLIYTSGTTGNPKGVMLSHDNITYTALATKSAVMQNVNLKFGNLSMVSYLPLSHIAAQMLDIYALMALGGTCYFAEPDALKGSLAGTLREVRPHVFLGVPRVWEKMMETMKTAGRNSSGLKKKIAAWAKGVGLKGNYARMNGGSVPFGFGLAEKLVFKKVSNILGFDRCEIWLSGAAPITKETLDYFLSLNIPLCEVYGMSECSGPHTVAFPKTNRVCSVGKELSPGITTVLDKMDEDGNGEVTMHGRHVLMGYINEVEKTKEVLNESGGLLSGDIGRKDKDGFLFITGRIKELIITAGGENIPPVAIEDMVKEALPVVSQCTLIGDKRKFLSLLMTFKVDVNQDTQEPSDRLTPFALDWVKSVGSAATTVTEILEPGDPVVLQAIQKGIDKVNSRARSNAQKIQKWSMLPKEYSIPGGELGPTLKMRRPVIHKKYANTIEGFYEEAKPATS